MSSWREHKRRARRDIHREMGVPALLLIDDQVAGDPLLIRGPHTKRPIMVGDLTGAGEGWAQREDTAPRIIFWRDQLPGPLRKNDVISVEVGEAYRIETVEPVNDQTVTAKVVPLTESQAEGLPVPESPEIPGLPNPPGPLPTPPDWAQIFRDREAAGGDV